MTDYVYRKHEIEIRRGSVEGEPHKVSGTGALIELAKDYYRGIDRELVLAFVLDDVNSLLGIYEVSRGGRSEAELDVTQVFRPAILLNGKKLMLVHNHPTGVNKPSEGDIRSAKAVFMLGSMLDIDVADNLVLDASNWSFQSVHQEPEFRRWLYNDLMLTAVLMSGANLTEEQREAAKKMSQMAQA